ncbi:MAG: VCBS repeat-containing protein, partial [Bacteroidia bacterium]|nr:VCBS repeat-containing protein [Bacteroidia bacterium]
MKNLTIILILVLLSCSCKKEVENDTLFTILPSSLTNIDFRNQLTENEEFNIIEYLYFNNGAGVAAGDINNDDLTDLYFVSNQQSNKLYLNKGNFIFEDITESSGLAGDGNWKTGVTMADVNGDGLLDIYLCQVGNYKSFNGRNQLFINQGNLKFKDEAGKYGVDFQGFSTQAAFFDFDLDGDLDMFLLNHSVHTSRSYGGIELRNDHDEMAGDRLYRNDRKNGQVYFTDITAESGI